MKTSCSTCSCGPIPDPPPPGWVAKYRTYYTYSWEFNGGYASYDRDEEDYDGWGDDEAEQIWDDEEEARLSLGKAVAKYLLENI